MLRLTLSDPYDPTEFVRGKGMHGSGCACGNVAGDDAGAERPVP
jgi:hypothetical protein